MPEDELKVALIGGGIIAGNHLAAIHSMEGLRACAVAEVDADKGDALANLYGIAAYQDYRLMIERERPDIAAIALPHHLHLEAAVFAASYGCHLMLEKPMAISTAECDVIMRAAESAGVRVLVGHTQQYMAENLFVRELIRKGWLGKVVMIHDVRHSNYFMASRPDWFLEKEKSGGGILANLGAHSIDKIQWLTDSLVRKVNAMTSYYGSRGNVEGSGMVMLELDNGIPATIVQSGYGGVLRNETEIIFTGGMIKLLTGDSVWVSRDGTYERMDVPKAATPFELQYADLLGAIRSGDETGCPPIYGRAVIAALEAVYRSASTGKEQYVER